MKKHSVLFIPIAFILLFSESPVRKNNLVHHPEGISRWSGTVTFVETVTINNEAFSGQSVRNITATFVDVLPTLYREDDISILDFTDDKGVGSHTYHSEGQVKGGARCVTDCQSSDKAELHAVVIRETENEYDIEVVSPNCIGTIICSDASGTTEYGPESRSVIVSNHSLGASKDILSGTTTVTAEVPGNVGTTVTTTTTWRLTRSVSDAELIITPDNYDDWLPLPGRDELTKGSVMNISLRVISRNGQPLKSRVRSFEVKLNNTSREPGITLNYPLQTSSRNSPDIGILLQTNISAGGEIQTAEIKCNNGVSGDVSVAAFDGGGYTTLTVVAIMEDNSRLEGHLLVSGGETEVPIPKRPPNSKIAAAWLGQYNNPGETEDDETSPGNNNNGDGLSAYEEYRGVISEGQFKRLDPRKKEVGVKMKRSEISFFGDGIAKFENASGLKVIRFVENEIGADRKLNKNKLSAHIYDQYALFLQKGALSPDLGKSFGGPGIPKQISKTVIAENNIRQAYQDRVAEANSMNTQIAYTLLDMFATITAHELAHSVSVQHHGSRAPNSMNLQFQQGRPVRIFSYNGTEILTRPYTITGRGGDKGNEQSGDVNCFMVNNALCDWAVTITIDSVFYYEVPPIPLGTTLCTKKDGTGLNKKDANGNNNYFGDAEKGNCLSQIKLK